MDNFNKLQLIKRRMFALRNGVIADTLRRGGSPFRIIFGLNMPQLAEMALEFGPDEEMARTLWANVSTRESMLLAPMLLTPEALSHSEVLEWVEQSPSAEIIDGLCHKLLRRRPDAFELACELVDSEKDVCRYAAMRLLWHQLSAHPSEVEAIAHKEVERNCPLTIAPARQIIDELEFLK